MGIDKSDVEKAKRLLEVVEQRKRLKKEETALKEHFKEKLPTDISFPIGGTSIMIVQSGKTILDRKALEKFVGTETYKSFCSWRSELKLTIQRSAVVAIHPKAWTGLIRKGGSND